MASEVVCTKNGQVRGTVVELKDGKPVHVYRNIPFAKPPLGKLRFMPPQPATPWEGVKDGTVVGNKPMCLTSFDETMDAAFPTLKPTELKPVIDEDCLHVTVYTPHPKKGKKLPVMVWLYGGAFQMGSEQTYNGTVLAGMNDVVVVIPNYRVGIFGFFSIPGQNSPCTGNAGLLDQQLALRWVQENIDSFGGDKDNVTIFGESAGSAAVHMNVISPLAKGLFHRAISHSGTSTMPGVFVDQDDATLRNHINVLLDHLKIEAEDDVKILEALQSLPGSVFLDASTALFEKKVYYAPNVDGKVLPKDTRDLLKEKNFAKVPYIFGCNTTEGHGLLAMYSGKDFVSGFTEEEAKAGFIIPMNDKGYELCKKEYLNEAEGERKFSKFLGDGMGDGLFVTPTIVSASLHSDAGADTYLYSGAFQLRMLHDDAFGPGVTKRPDWCICDHGDDVYMTFGAPFSPKDFPNGVKFTEEEAKLSRRFMTYLTNFARTGDPNKGKKVDVEWPKYHRGGGHLVVAHPFKVETNLAEKALKFWTEVMPPYMKKET